jgi:hypothetical protein
LRGPSEPFPPFARSSGNRAGAGSNQTADIYPRNNPVTRCALAENPSPNLGPAPSISKKIVRPADVILLTDTPQAPLYILDNCLVVLYYQFQINSS